MVDVKPSARRSNGAVGRALHREGRRRTFDSRPEADEWADALSEEGERRVWVRDANPDDGTGADGYLVGRRPPRGGVVRVEGPDGGSQSESERRGTGGGGRVAPAAADQSALDAHADDDGGRDASDGDDDVDGDGGG